MYKNLLNSIVLCSLLSVSGFNAQPDQPNQPETTHSTTDEDTDKETNEKTNDNEKIKKYFFYGFTSAVTACLLLDYILFKLNPTKVANISKFTELTPKNAFKNYFLLPILTGMEFLTEASYLDLWKSRLNLHSKMKFLITIDHENHIREIEHLLGRWYNYGDMLKKDNPYSKTYYEDFYHDSLDSMPESLKVHMRIKEASPTATNNQI